MHTPQQLEPIAGSALAAQEITTPETVVENVAITAAAHRARAGFLQPQEVGRDTEVGEHRGPRRPDSRVNVGCAQEWLPAHAAALARDFA